MFVPIKKDRGDLSSQSAMRKLVEAFEEYVAALRDAAVDIDEKELIERTSALPWTKAGEQLRKRWLVCVNELRQISGDRAAQKIRGHSFSLDNPYSARWAEAHGARLVKEVTTTTREAINSYVARAIDDGRTVHDLARDIRGFVDRNGTRHHGLVGLLERDIGAVEGYRERLVDSGMDSDRIREMVDRYSQRLLNRRGENIARTESAFASERGKHESWFTARDEGLIGDDSYLEWYATPDERTCDICGELHGVQANLGDTFDAGEWGEVEQPPAHPSCRCVTLLRTPVGGRYGRSEEGRREGAEDEVENAVFESFV